MLGQGSSIWLTIFEPRRRPDPARSQHKFSPRPRSDGHHAVLSSSLLRVSREPECCDTRGCDNHFLLRTEQRNLISASATGHREAAWILPSTENGGHYWRTFRERSSSALRSQNPRRLDKESELPFHLDTECQIGPAPLGNLAEAFSGLPNSPTVAVSGFAVGAATRKPGRKGRKQTLPPPALSLGWEKNGQKIFF